MVDKKVNQHSATIDDVLLAVDSLAGKTEKRFEEVFEVVNFIKDNAVTRDEFKEEIGGVKEEIGGVKEEIGGIKGELGGINKRLTRVESLMVTKDYLDDKLADLRGDLVFLARKGDVKLKALVGVLHGKAVITAKDVKKIYSMEPFAQ